MDNPIATPSLLTTLVDYQAGSVVSRVLFRNEGCVMTAFAFAEGEGLTEHSTPHDAAVQLLEGTVRISVAGEHHDVEAGQILHLPAGIPHTLHGGKAFKMLLILMKKSP